MIRVLKKHKKTRKKLNNNVEDKPKMANKKEKNNKTVESDLYYL